jgi:hypothetical protein
MESNPGVRIRTSDSLKVSPPDCVGRVIEPETVRSHLQHDHLSRERGLRLGLLRDAISLHHGLNAVAQHH